MKKPDVSIIVLCWNHLEDLTKPFLKSIEKTVGVDYELVFWDNGSKDGTLEWLLSMENTWATHVGRKIVVRGAPENIGFGAGNNEAVKFATGRYILFLNNDILFNDPKWLSKMVEYADSHPKEMVGAQLIDFNSATEFRHVIQPYMGGWCALIDHEFVKEHGAFHPDFGWAYFEDSELSKRALHYGYKLKQLEVDITHLGSISSADQLNIPEQFKYNKSVYRNLLYDYEKGTSKRIVFFAPGMYPFNDSSYEEEGVGGAEASLILLTRQLAKLGYIVDVYNDTQVEGNFSGVNWNNIANFDYDDYSDIFILFRNSMVGLENVYAGEKWFWSCDQMTTNDWDQEIIPYVTKVIAISDYHRKYLITHTMFDPKIIEVISLGINATDYRQVVDKVPGKLIYCSVPRRGLKYLAEYFPLIKEQVPNAELYITSDYSLWGSTPDNETQKALFKDMPGVHFLGKVKRSELVKHQLEAMVMAYPCNYDENFCIAAMECIAAGAYPVTTNIGAMGTTVGKSGKLISYQPGTQPYKEQFVSAVVSQLTKPIKVDRQRGWDYDWFNIAKTWHNMFMAKDTHRKANYCEKCGKLFDNGYDFFKHRAEKHPILLQSPRVYNGAPKVDVLIKTTRRVDLSLNTDINYFGVRELRVPQKSASDVVRILTEAYGEGVIETAKTITS